VHLNVAFQRSDKLIWKREFHPFAVLGPRPVKGHPLPLTTLRQVAADCDGIQVRKPQERQRQQADQQAVTAQCRPVCRRAEPIKFGRVHHIDVELRRWRVIRSI
jgi:hypothetical protein